ncbi:hypothetical protein [Oceanisphaera pacifica]|uniref:AraC-type arabinose-binding/dimerisation domain-containing protein n=1 Tax=Oceanisphaera pacifica TaxID=2818389 RepID=A0ABS3NCP7_9GAMM|nr:hypothetical protein [Oceanisphaera pacifica]MBO1518364.1 hypothetical protein [Oceanisphaera pacifica]
MTTSAQYSIDYQLLELAHLSPGKRQRHLKGRLLVIHQGGGLLQLGRYYYPLTNQDVVFLPANTLFAWHSFAHSRVSQLAFSPRLTQPTHAGRIHSALISECATRLAHWQEPQDWQGAYGRLCWVIHDELLRHQPRQLKNLGTLLQSISDNPSDFRLTSAQEAECKQIFNADSDTIKQQCALLCILRDLSKTPQLEQLVLQHGLSSVSEFEQACAHWLSTGNDTGVKNG